MEQTSHTAQAGASSSPQTEAHLRLLVETGLLLASERSLDVIVQAALDAGLQLCGARFGAFFYSNIGDDGQPYQLYKLSGAAAEAFAGFPLPPATQIFTHTFVEAKILRSDDITQDPRYGRSGFAGMPHRHIPVRSYLAVPVRSRSGEVLGALLYGHPDPSIFAPACETLVSTVAAQAAVAIDNARLAESLTREIAITNAARAAQRESADRFERDRVAAERRLRQALDAAQLGTWTWDRATDMLDLDERAAELFYTEPHIPVGRSFLRDRIVAPQDRQTTSENLKASLDSGGLYKAEYRVQNPARPTDFRWIEASGLATCREGSTDIIGMIGVIQDVTDRNTHEVTLRQSEKLAATGRLAATIAHEINNPLEAVTNLIYLAKTDPEVPSAAQRLLEAADAELLRVAQIAQQTLGFYRDTTRPVEINLNELLASVVDLFSRKLVYARLTCTLELEPNLCVFGLQGEIRQVFSNLLVNAIDAAQSAVSSSRLIRIRARRHSDGRDGVAVLVCDSGSGISAAVREQLFAPFITTKPSLGTGLGLWVTRGIVEKHGGSVTFRTTTTPPTGTIFRVFLPLKIENPEVFSMPQSSAIQ